MRLTEDSIKYLKLQRSQFNSYSSIKEIEKVYNNICENNADFLMNNLPKNIKTANDIGCGLGGIAYYLIKKYGLFVYLLDKNGLDSNKRSIGFGESSSFAGYNSADLTESILKESGVSAFKYINVDLPFEMPKSDLCYSLLSWGFHYPLSTYWDKIKSNHLICDCRRGVEKPEGFKLIRSSKEYDTCHWVFK